NYIEYLLLGCVRMVFQQISNNFSLILILPMFVLWAFLIASSLYLIFSNKDTKKNLITLSILSVLIGGIILGGIPSAIMPIQEILMVIAGKNSFNSVIPMIIILSILLLSSLIVGRIFCGFACPVGALQELISKFKFKSNVEKQEKVKTYGNVSQKKANTIRWSFLIVSIFMSLILGFPLLQLINPFLGFSFLRVESPTLLMAFFPLITLISVIFLSIFIYRPYCRFLCPFGALASLISRYSKYKYKRSPYCTDCELCEKICPTEEASRESTKEECYYCGRCMEVCPQRIACDSKLCTGCEICESVCSFVHDGEFNPINTRIYRVRIEPLLNTALTCQKCEGAPCIRVCSHKALYKDTNGSIAVDNEKCIGCGFCVRACDFGVISLHLKTQKAVICDLCEGMRDEFIDHTVGRKQPQCIELCPQNAISLKKSINLVKNP
ncbi:MAG: 4Fe-4S binding protein, partial [Promethearchaeia archaeon]